MTGRIPSMGNRSVAPEMINMSMSIDSNDMGDKYGMEGDEDARRPMTSNYTILGAFNNDGVQYGDYNRYDSPFMQESASCHGNNTTSMKSSTQQLHNRMEQPACKILHSPMNQQNFQPLMTNGMIQHRQSTTQGMIQHRQPTIHGYETQHQQSISHAPLSSQRRTFMA